MQTTLTEVKKGQTGCGLLVENDGYMSLDVKGNELLKESLGENNIISTKDLPNPFVVSAVFQKYGIENANGRIYPEAVLRREVERYQQAIKERRAYGECYTPDAECLTKDGWKLIKDVTTDDEVLTMKESTLETEFQGVVRLIDIDYDGDIYNVKNDFIDDRLTGNHRYSVYSFNNDYIFKCSPTIETLAGGRYKNAYVLVSQDGRIGTEVGSLTFTKERYTGKVYCIEVPNHTFFVRQNGKTHWTRNCNHPEQTSLDLGRLAENIIELHWEGSTLVGKMELPITPGYRNMGIISCYVDMIAHWILSGWKIGVSSRALGSVERDSMGRLIVQDDLSLICWDVVGEPSTPSAWIEMNEKNLQPYIEAKEKKGEIIEETSTGDKLSKFRKWLND